ncbi:hypothetical protein NE172_13120 [Clostridium botulinum]|uniref:Uncharacterized protein n=1 Tax=Clostridium botulinum TaxID=1491 RepID=A0A6B4JPP1_CLOBO|nr:hypothetical protein [Clostridium botulinum]EES48062.1 hypothetical protein CLO_3762 [Clostridium botulinum E1 str. 'BoNT E Beluga']MBY6762413.1 hypothetical protein [Clostridium botulinum]MBY6921255.1 hypothetical protein [Clostridium botulinum]MCR1131886.1 hypothetical protein [Clostridium botulinum]NFJ58914.1 hypothetical protein [Clostridium botulinum]
MKIKLYSNSWKYHLILGLPTRDVKLKEIEEEIFKATDLFNQYSLKSANKKEIINCNITALDTLEITLISQQRLPVAIRGLKLFTAKVIETILSERGEDEGNKLISMIMRRRSLFKTVSVEETYINPLTKEDKEKALKSTSLNNGETMENNINILTNDYGIEELKKETFEIIRFYLKCIENNEFLLENKELITNNYQLINK